MEQIKKERIHYMDAARTAAILLIMLNHAVNRTWANYNKVQEEFADIGKLSTVVKTLLTVASRMGVPLFLMLTGALILRKRFETKEDFKHFYRHNWLPLFITSEIWTFLGFWFQVLVKPYKPPLADALLGERIWACVKTMLFIDMVRFDSMWYIPMILSIYLVIPLIAFFLQRSAYPKAILFPLAGAFLCDMLMPAINSYLEIFEISKLSFAIYDFNFISFYLIYVVAGYYLASGGLSRFSDRAVALGALLSYLACCGLQFFCYSCSSHLLAYSSPGILLTSIFLFECFRRFANRLGKLERPVTFVSRASFGVYLLHVFFLWSIYWYCSFSGWSHVTKVMLFEFVPLAASLLLIWLLIKIPFCRKYLFLFK